MKCRTTKILIVLLITQFFLSQAAFHFLEDRIHALDVEEQKQNCLCIAKVGPALMFTQ